MFVSSAGAGRICGTTWLCRATVGKWHDVNRKQRREMMRKMQSEDLSLVVIHPDACTLAMAVRS